MKIAYLDCFAGASGDMILGALLDAGVPLEGLQAELARLDVGGYRLEARRVTKRGVSATKVDVVVEDHHHHRPLRRILEILERSSLTPEVRDLARRIFLRLGEAEGRVHGVPAEEVHFHEVGSTDAIVDIVGAAAGFRMLQADRMVVSPIHLGRGFVRIAHGLYPIPAPATAYLLEGMPVYSTDVTGELTTPTGAAILAEVAGGSGPVPPMSLARVGYGAGTADREIPNVLRLLIGDAASEHTETVTELAANIDDMNPQLYDHLMTRLLGAGALDAWLTPVQMKKNRPGVVVQALARPADADRLTEILLAESTTLGVRQRDATRTVLEREVITAETVYGPVRVKVARGPGGQVVNSAPEYEDCLALAAQHGVPLKLVYTAALGAAISPSERSGSLPGPPLR